METIARREPSSDNNPFVLSDTERNSAQTVGDRSLPQGGSPTESLYGLAEAEKQRRKIAFYHQRKTVDGAVDMQYSHNISPYNLPKLPRLPSGPAGLMNLVNSFKRNVFFTSRKERAVEIPLSNDELLDETLMSPTKLTDLRAHSASKFGRGSTSHRVELRVIRDAVDFTRTSMGGEGVHYIQASKKAGSGNWISSILAIRGRPFGFWPMAIYSSYSALVVCLLQWHINANPLNPSGTGSNAISTGGSINGTQSTTQIIQGLQSSVYLISTALFFLQTFRTNHSYNRWWEGRCLWAQISAHILTISRTVAGGHIKSQQLGRKILRWTAAFLVTMKASLRGEDNLDDLEGLLSSTEIEALEVKHIDFRPLLCLQKIQEAWGMCQDDKLIRECASKELEKVMPDLSTGMMALQRVASTSMPFGYVSHMRSFLVIWLCLLPFVYVYQMTYYAIGICFIIAYSLLGMEVLSLELESPFGRNFNHLPVDSMTKQTLSELFESYSTTVNLPRIVGSAPASAGEEEEEEPVLFSSKRSVATARTGQTMQRHNSTNAALRPVPEDSTNVGGAEDFPDLRGLKIPNFAKKSDGSYRSIKAEKSSGWGPSFHRSSLGDPVHSRHENQGRTPPRHPPTALGVAFNRTSESEPTNEPRP